MPSAHRSPTVLSIAGSDSGGGAGIQADLKTFASLGVHGTTAITCVTAQNPSGVSGIQPVTPKLLEKQLMAVHSAFRPETAKAGMLYSKTLIEVTAAFMDRRSAPRLVLDPVMVATSGALLLKKDAIHALKKKLMPLAALITPNLDETRMLTGRTIESVEAMRVAARQIFESSGCAVYLKGGHLKNTREAVDLFYAKDCELLLTAPLIKGGSLHGTGCTLSASIAGHLAKGVTLEKSVEMAKNHISHALFNSMNTRGGHILNPF